MNSVAYSIAPSLKYRPNDQLPSISKKVRWDVSRPTSSMSPVRNTFWTFATRGAGGSSRFRKYGMSGCIPAEMNSVLWSSARGISDAEGCLTCPFSSKKERNSSRSSAVVGIARLLDLDLLADLLERAPDQPGDVHLRDPDVLRDLGLREPVEEPQVENHPLAVVEHPQARLEDGPLLRDLVARLLGADHLQGIELVLVVAAAEAGEIGRAHV